MSPKWEESLARLLRMRGVCPPVATLIEFQAGLMTGRESELLRRHVELCGQCQLSLSVCKSIDEAAQVEENGAAPGWDRASRRLMARLAGPPPSRTDWLSGLWRTLRHPAFTYGLICVLTYLAFRDRLPGGRTPVPIPSAITPASPLFAATRVLALDRRDLRGPSSPNALLLKPEDRFLTLQFFVPLRAAPGLHYSLRLEGPAGPVLKVPHFAGFDAVGNGAVLVARGNLSPGRHLLIVEEYERSDDKPVETYQFPFDISM